jgi:hypothetical protein
MAYRTFLDSRNNYWQVWDVRPDRIERRSVERREGGSAEWKGVERRSGERRRLDQRRIVLDNGLGSGWLVFESKTEKRRLNPIPSCWDTCTESELRSCCEKAKVVPGNGNGSGSTSAA